MASLGGGIGDSSFPIHLLQHMDLELQREQLMCLSLICTTQEVKELPYK